MAQHKYADGKHRHRKRAYRHIARIEEEFRDAEAEIMHQKEARGRVGAIDGVSREIPFCLGHPNVWLIGGILHGHRGDRSNLQVGKDKEIRRGGAGSLARCGDKASLPISAERIYRASYLRLRHVLGR